MPPQRSLSPITPSFNEQDDLNKYADARTPSSPWQDQLSHEMSVCSWDSAWYTPASRWSESLGHLRASGSWNHTPDHSPEHSSFIPYLNSQDRACYIHGSLPYEQAMNSSTTNLGWHFVNVLPDEVQKIHKVSAQWELVHWGNEKILTQSNPLQQWKEEWSKKLLERAFLVISEDAEVLLKYWVAAKVGRWDIRTLILYMLERGIPMQFAIYHTDAPQFVDTHAPIGDKRSKCLWKSYYFSPWQELANPSHTKG